MSTSGSPAPSRVDDKVSPDNKSTSMDTTPQASTVAPAATAPNGIAKTPNATANTTAKTMANGLLQNKTKSTTSLAARPRLKTGHSTPNMNGPLYMQTSGNSVVLVRRLRRKDEGTWKHLSRWFVENQVGKFLSAPSCTCSNPSISPYSWGRVLELRVWPEIPQKHPALHHSTPLSLISPHLPGNLPDTAVYVTPVD